jgi:glycosyltransferase involved in cell wall biosynthesis
VPNFVESVDDAPVGAGEVAALREAHGRHILYFGRLSPEKGVDVLIDAAAAANAPLTIVGDGPQRSALEAQAWALGARCLFTEPVAKLF